MTDPTSLPETLSALIIGGGPSGIVSLKYLLEYGPRLGLVERKEIENGGGVMAVEMEGEIGGTFRSVGMMICGGYTPHMIDHPSSAMMRRTVSRIVLIKQVSRVRERRAR